VVLVAVVAVVRHYQHQLLMKAQPIALDFLLQSLLSLELVEEMKQQQVSLLHAS
jgi:hypothetical protein